MVSENGFDGLIGRDVLRVASRTALRAPLVLVHGDNERKTGNDLYVRLLACRAHGAGNASAVGVSSRLLVLFRCESGEGVQPDDVGMY